jgi:hypothetical protein
MASRKKPASSTKRNGRTARKAPPAAPAENWLIRFKNQLRARGRFGASFKDLVERLVVGRGPFGEAVARSAGARMCVNMAAVHVVGFCTESRGGNHDAYKNAYDVADSTNRPVSPRRTRVDAALPLPPGQTPRSTYFGAVELTGCGIRFYGDVSLILRSSDNLSAATILDRNSFELTRPPLSSDIAKRASRLRIRHAEAMKQVARTLAGRWSTDLAAMVGIKLLDTLPQRKRPETAGMMMAAVIEDEDYVEVLKQGSFQAGDLQEARVTAADAGAEANIGDRLRVGASPSATELLWRYQRRQATRALRELGVDTHTVVTRGRTR